jgi:hypothetical protein
VIRKRSFRLAVAAVGAAASLQLTAGQTAFADASGEASCIGIEASSISPPGSSLEFPGGMPELLSFVRGTGAKIGPVVSSSAKVHAGSHEACE